jgi:hypothetical protein
MLAEEEIMQQLMTVTEFIRSEPAIKSEQRAYQMIRAGLLPSVRIGRRIYVDPAQWETFKASGGKSLPGGWRKEPKEAA